MPLPQPTPDDKSPTKPKTPTLKTTAPKSTTPKSSTPKPSTVPTPQRTTAVPKTTPNGTPSGQTGIKPRSPASAPIRNRPPAKKAEPTLLTDFLLGRPSPSRQRRKSLDAVKAEMRESAVNKVRAPGGVHDRVKQWQKASAAAVVEEADAPKDDLDEIVVIIEEESVVEGDKLRIPNHNTRPGRRKSRENSEEGKAKVRSKSAPRKRVISDDHWVMNKNKTPPAKKESKATTRAIPKNFLKQTAANPKLEKKIADWVKRNEAEAREESGSEPEPLSRPRTSQSQYEGDKGQKTAKSARQDVTVEINKDPKAKSWRDELVVEADPTPRSRKSSNNGSKEDVNKIPRGRQTPKSEPSRTPANDGIRVKPFGNTLGDDGIRVKPINQRPRTTELKRPSTGSNPFLDGISVKPLAVRKEEKKSPIKAKPSDTTDSARRNSAVFLKMPKEIAKPDKGNHSEGNHDDGGVDTPTRSSSKRQPRRSRSPSQAVDDIPFGDSAFSSLDLPLGAEAGTLNKPKPQRNPSLSVPKVLKRVYNEGKKIIHDTPEAPPRGGINQPPSIESWLNNTTDPFLDGTAPSSRVAEEPARTNNAEPLFFKHERESDLKQSLADDQIGSRQKRTRKPSKTHEGDRPDDRLDTEFPLNRREERSLEEAFQLKKPLTPPAAALRRSPATRSASPPIRSARKLPFKNALFDAFRGESTLEDVDESNHDHDTEQENHHNSRDFKSADHAPKSTTQDLPSRHNSRSSYEKLDVPGRVRNNSGNSRRRRRNVASGDHRLSTIASVETFSTSSSAADSSSNLTKTTLTQATTNSGPSDSNVSRKRSNKSGLKRRLTKHSDLVSMLSLPDTTPPGRAQSIRSARSVRTTRISLEVATVSDLMNELEDDEAKYTRELKTLVDGVIPVLLTCVLSKSNSAIAAGLFNPDSTSVKDTYLTKPILDMGVALERLKNLHKKIPLDDAGSLVAWLHRAHRTYQEYTRAWRLGFQDVIVNLAPVSRRASADESTLLDSVPRNADGDVVNANGERVDVAFLLKRPLVRIKYLAKLAKGLDKLNHTEISAQAVKVFTELQETARRRVKEECARLEDLYANSTDSTRARDPQTLAPVEDTNIDRSRQVYAKDFFALDFPHSNGQRIECRVELILRDSSANDTNKGDILVCASDITAETTDRYLLFPPVSRELISACAGQKPGQIVVMIRGMQGPVEWHESFHLEISEPETAAEWIAMLGSEPTPHPVLTSMPDDDDDMVSVISMDPSEITNCGDPEDVDLPIGARRRRSSRRTPTRERPRSSTYASPPSCAPETSTSPEPELRNSPSERPSAKHRDGSYNDLAGASPMGRTKPARYHTRTRSTPSSPLANQVMHGDEDNRDDKAAEDLRSQSITPGRTQRRPLTPSAELPYIPKVRKTSSRSSIDSSSTNDDPRPESPDSFMTPTEQYNPYRNPESLEDEEASAPPPPPVHRSLSPLGLKKPIIIEPPTPKAKTRRTSSPLKHEYQPSDASDASETSYSSSEESETDTETEDQSSSASSSDEDEFESADLPEVEPAASIYGRRVSPTASLYSLPNVTLAPSNSASQGPYRVPIAHRPVVGEVAGDTTAEQGRKHTATVTSWNNSKGRWDDICSGPCSVLVSAGLIQVFELSSSHTNPAGLSTIEESVVDSDGSREADKRPLIAQVLTPVVTLRQSTSVDIEVHSPPTDDSRIKCSATIRYRSTFSPACCDLYKSIHKARVDNPIYRKLEEERRVNAYGGAPYETSVAPSKRSSFFGRKKSYRASARAPSLVNSDQSSSPSTSRFSDSFKRLTGSSFFNIAKSSVERGSMTSLYTSSSGLTPPRTPNSASLAGTSTSYGGVNHTSENLKIRLYYLETRSQWRDCGNARLTVTTPPPGMRQACTVDQGIERRILVTRKPLNLGKAEDSAPVEVLLDVVLGANCFSMIGNKGVTCNVWEDLVGPNGEVGMVGAIGRVSGRTRKWCLQAGSVPETNWIYSLVSVGR